MEAAEFFDSSSPPSWLADTRARLIDFVGRHSSARIVCVTSGGTTVPLERNTVRFIDNFSTGNRGAASSERFLDAGYAVVFLHRAHSTFPFARKLLPPSVSIEEWLKQADSEESNAKLTAAASRYRQHATHLLALPFTTVYDYLFLLREAACSLAPSGPCALLYLAAAVSDFYVPDHVMVEHKIQSANATAEHAEGGITIKLWPVPKLLGAIKGTSSPWASEAFLVSFKLETNR